MIHPTALIEPDARLGAGTTVGPYALIGARVTLGLDCIVGAQVQLMGHTTVGAGNRFHAGAVIGDTPQDLKFGGEPTGLRIGVSNVFREHVTIHRSAKAGEDTVIGDGNLFMVGSHVGHNCQLGSHNIIANGALLAGHVTLADRAFISGNCLVHQFCRVGRLAMMQGGAAISKDLPPFCIARGDNSISGLNSVGLRRAGFTTAQRLEIKRAYHRLFRAGLRLTEALAQAQTEFAGIVAVKELLEFVAASQRGVCSDHGRGPVEED